MSMKKRVLLVFLLLALVAVAVIWGSNYATYSPRAIIRGENNCWIGQYDLKQEGFAGLEKIIDRSADMPENYTVAYFTAAVDKNGNVKSFRLSLDTFDENKMYYGLAGYTYADKKLSYNPPVPSASEIVSEWNPNSTIEYLDAQIKQIPLTEQIKISGLDRYVLEYQPYTIIENGVPIFDGRTNTAFPVLSKEDYNAGVGGVSDGKTNIVFRLYDGQSIAMGQQYLYVFTPVDAEATVGNRLSTMQCDYYINNGSLKFTRDYGESWMDADITKGELDATMEFYRNRLALPPQSVFIAVDPALPIAYFYGVDPILKISFDDGASWAAAPFPTATEFGRQITKRSIGFTSPEFGYVGLGTDWSMGAGENKMSYFTFDGGRNWTDKSLPLAGTSNTLKDMAMADEKRGIVALDAGMDTNFPLLYATVDTGDSWQEIQLPYEDLPQEVQYLSDIDSLTYEDGIFTLILGQNDSGTVKATFTSTDINEGWEYTEMTKKNIHTVG